MKKLLLATATCLAFVGMANACGTTTTTTRICYLRNYDRAHLAQHPDQSVTAMRISLSPPGVRWQDSYGFDLSVLSPGAPVYRSTDPVVMKMDAAMRTLHVLSLAPARKAM